MGFQFFRVRLALDGVQCSDEPFADLTSIRSQKVAPDRRQNPGDFHVPAQHRGLLLTVGMDQVKQ